MSFHLLIHSPMPPTARVRPRPGGELEARKTSEISQLSGKSSMILTIIADFLDLHKQETGVRSQAR